MGSVQKKKELYSVNQFISAAQKMAEINNRVIIQL